jgi:5-methylcytosine-specific restriction endonuclease McrA
MKTCSKCQQTLDASAFGRDKRATDGLKYWCKGCVRAGIKAWQAANPEKMRAYRAQWAANNPEKSQARGRLWCENNRDKVALRNHRRRARYRGAEGSYTRADVLGLYAEQNGLCPYCSVSLEDTYHVDHIMPLARGGTNYRSNIQLTCAPCNLRKHAKDPVEFAASLQQAA